MNGVFLYCSWKQLSFWAEGVDGAGSKHCRKTYFSFTRRPSKILPPSVRQEIQEGFESTSRVLTIAEQGTMPGKYRKVFSTPLPEQGDGIGQSCPALNVLVCKEEQGVLLVWKALEHIPFFTPIAQCYVQGNTSVP